MSRKDRLRNQQLAQRPPVGQFQITAASSQFSGPLPPPELLAKYNEILPGAAERIIAMAERQSTHRQELEKRVIDSNCQAQKRGPILGFIIAMTTVVGGIFLIYKGKGAAGLTSVITALVGLVAVFFYGKKRQQKELAERAQAIIEHP